MPIFDVLERYGLGAAALIAVGIMWWQLDTSDRRFEKDMAAFQRERAQIVSLYSERIDAHEVRLKQLEKAPELTEEQRAWRSGVTREFDRLESRVLRLEEHRMESSRHPGTYAP